MRSSTRPAAVHTQNPEEDLRPMMIAAAGYPIVLVVGSEVPSLADPSRQEAPREVGTGSVGDRGVEGVDQRDGSKLTRVVGYLCLCRTWKLLSFRVSSTREIAGRCTKSCSCGRGVCKHLAEKEG